MKLDCFVMSDNPPRLIPGRGDRDWMDDFQGRFPYRCLPLVMANTTGWEILCPFDITVVWNGGPRKEDLVITKDGASDEVIEHFVASHFSHGVLTFHTGYLFRTEPGFAVIACGAPNHIKDGIAPLTGLVQTDWLPFPFTMNWKMTRPGIVEFKKNEPFCFIQIVAHQSQDNIEPVLRSIYDEPDLLEQFSTWSKVRSEFNAALTSHEPEAVKESWQKFYFKGQRPNEKGNPVPMAPDHVNRRRLKAPVWSPTALPYRGSNDND
jgi:hypothetical protein